MTLKKYTKFYELTFWSFYSFFIILFLCLFSIHSGLFLGYAIGGLLSYLFWKINLVIASWVLRKTKKTYGYLFFLFKSLIVFVFLSLVLYFSWEINFSFATNVLNEETNLFTKVNKPINLFTLLFGLSLNFIVIITLNVIERIKTKSKKGAKWIK